MIFVHSNDYDANVRKKKICTDAAVFMTAFIKLFTGSAFQDDFNAYIEQVLRKVLMFTLSNSFKITNICTFSIESQR
jgi:hypothetical protein